MDCHRSYINNKFGIPSVNTIAGIDVRLDAVIDSKPGKNTVMRRAFMEWRDDLGRSQEYSSVGCRYGDYLLGRTTDTWGRTWSANLGEIGKTY